MTEETANEIIWFEELLERLEAGDIADVKLLIRGAIKILKRNNLNPLPHTAETEGE